MKFTLNLQKNKATYVSLCNNGHNLSEQIILVQHKVGCNVWNPIVFSLYMWVDNKVEEANVVDHTWKGTYGTFYL
jgi:hypothetical protein